jgi:hypothetical protein
LDLSAIMSCLAKSLQLLGNVNDHIRNKGRAQVLSQIGQRYTSLSEEAWETNFKDLFGTQFEQRLKQRAETAQTISSANFILKRKQFFSKKHLLPKAMAEKRCKQLLPQPSGERPVLPSKQTLQGKRPGNNIFPQTTQSQ